MKRLILLFTSLISFAQNPKSLSSSEILHNLHKLNVVGNVLYVAAHPDDENTLLITYLAQEKKLRTAYIAMTRGDGGQNLVGNEQDEYVGLLRTHELLGARSIDGGEQYFTRAKDYGFTKTTEEAMLTWQKEQVLADLVFRIRKFQPDVIINRFPPDPRAGHGHHSASAVLSKEAFEAAADPNRFPEQLSLVKPWQATRLVWNSYSPGFQNKEPDGSFVKIPLGEFNPLLGKSYTEIAADARSMHKSQGFGSAKTRNNRSDFALHVAGTPAVNDILDGINTSWSRLEGGNGIAEKIDKVITAFNLAKPAASIPGLVSILSEIETLEPSVYKDQKIKETKELIAQCSGLWYEFIATENFSTPGENIKASIQVVSRTDVPILLNKVVFKGFGRDTIVNTMLKPFEQINNIVGLQIPQNTSITQPYWLTSPYQKGLFVADDLATRGLPMSPPSLAANFQFMIAGKEISFEMPLQYKFVEPSDGEKYRYFEVRPEATINLAEPVYAFGDAKPRKITVLVRSSKANFEGMIDFEDLNGWQISPKSLPISLKDKNVEKSFEFLVTPPAASSEIQLKAMLSLKNGTKLNRGFNQIIYDHVPTLTSFPIAQTKLLKIDLKKKGQNIGYITGTGDKTPQALEQIGYKVSILNKTNLASDLSKFDAIVVGVRAYNTEDYLVDMQDKLLKYVENGGTMVVQYQTNAFYGGLKLNNLGPYPFSIKNGRVSREEAEVQILKPNHPLLNKPNKITKADFEGWVQERGLYFSDKWDGKYETLFSMKDPGENDQEGSFLYAKYGKGHYVFTSLAFFRQLPAGVSGAYRIFSNLLSAGK